jgi:2-dehydro-3-deoxygluconokinase
MTTTEVVTLGECLISLIAAHPGSLAEAAVFERHVAGAEANVAVGLARLGHTVAYIGRVGNDGFGTAIVRRLRGEGVDVSQLAVDPGATTGLMLRERRVLGASEVVYARTGSAGSRVTADDVRRAQADGVFGEARWLHLTGITPALSDTAREATTLALDIADAAGMTVSFDVNLRRRLWSEEAAAPVLRPLAERSDIVFGSPDELAVVTGTDETDPVALAKAVLAFGPGLAVVKRGADGALAVERGGDPVWSQATASPTVVDPVGAGDAFCAGFIASRIEGDDLGTTLTMANACGAAAVAAVGDLAGLPTRTELARLIADDGQDTIR